jgi:phosphoribosylglycinamide formyltransferase-1
MQAVLDACKVGSLNAEVTVVISNNASSKALARARAESIPAYHLSGITHPEFDRLDQEIARTLEFHGVELVLLAGYMKKVGPRTIARYPRRILNIHPALLPKFGGVGMYGRRVHEAVLASGDTVTGVTIHLVDDEYDHGPIVAQCEVPVLPGDDVESLAVRVLEREHAFYVETLRRIASGSLDLDRVPGYEFAGPDQFHAP